MIFLLSITLNVNSQENITVSGNGNAIIGNGITLEEAEQIALTKAKRDALDKMGSYIESRTVIDSVVEEIEESGQNANEEKTLKVRQIVRDNISSMSAGIVKIKPGTKNVKKEMNNENFVVKVEAIFLISQKELAAKIDEYIKNMV